jgi:hypothetical protein
VLPRAGVDVAVLEPARFDVMELRREFHGGGALNDPVAGEALLDAIRVLRENFERLQDGDALIVTYGHPADGSPDH